MLQMRKLCLDRIKEFAQDYAANWLPRWHSGIESTCHSKRCGSIPGLGRSLGVGNGNPLQYSCLENPVDRGVWRAALHGVIKSEK